MSSFFHSSSSSSSYYVPESQDVVFIETTICLKCLANWILRMLQNTREVYSIHFYLVFFMYIFLLNELGLFSRGETLLF